MWIKFYDMSSGGTEKTPYVKIFIEAKSKDKAINIFEKKFKISPYNITCNCCGQDFSISEVEQPEYGDGYLVINNNSK